MDRGYLKLWRKAAESEVFACPHLWHLWSWCLIKASYKVRTVSFKTGKGLTIIKLSPGQFIFGRDSAAQSLGQPPSTIRNRMKRLEEAGMVNIGADNQYSIITICNWENYQNDDTENGQPKDNQRTTEGQPKDTNKKDKKGEKETTRGDACPSSPPCLHQEIISLYNSILPSLANVKLNLWKSTSKRGKALQARWREDKSRQNPVWWKDFFMKVNNMPFLLGQNDSGWRADLEWMLKAENFTKILEGKYQAKEESEWI